MLYVSMYDQLFIYFFSSGSSKATINASCMEKQGHMMFDVFLSACIVYMTNFKQIGNTYPFL